MNPLSTDINSPVDEVAQVVEQLAVVLQHQVAPAERTVHGLGPDVQQIETPDVAGDSRLLSHVAKDAHAPALGELAVLVVQVFCKDTTQW